MRRAGRLGTRSSPPPRGAGLIYPIVVALISIVIGARYIRESRHVRIWDEVGGHEMEPQYDAPVPATSPAG